jgi:hypothetical protein
MRYLCCLSKRRARAPGPQGGTRLRWVARRQAPAEAAPRRIMRWSSPWIYAAAGGVVVVLSTAGCAGPSSGSGPSVETASSTSSSPGDRLTRSGLLLTRFESTLRQAFRGRAVCEDLNSKEALRFVACRPPAARYAYFAYTFKPTTAVPLPLNRIAPKPGAFGVTNSPIQIGSRYVLCQSGHYLLRTSAVSFGLGCS